MAFKSNDLSVLAYEKGFTLWHYTTTDSLADVDNDGYFNDASEMLRSGDIVLANVDTTGGVPQAGFFLVTVTPPGSVNVANMTPIGEKKKYND